MVGTICQVFRYSTYVDASQNKVSSRQASPMAVLRIVPKPTWEFTRLCRGGSKSLTYPAVNAARSIAATRRAANHRKGIVSMDGLKADASDHGAVMQALPPEQGSQARDIMLRHSSVEEVQPR